MALIRIPIVDNTAVESDEIFIAALSSEDNNVMIDGKSVTIMILDLDSKYFKRIVFFSCSCHIIYPQQPIAQITLISKMVESHYQEFQLVIQLLSPAMMDMS